MRDNENKVTLVGKVYQHDLAIKTVQNKESENFGKPFINGTLEVQTDAEGLNIVKVHFTYVSEMTKAGKKSSTFSSLEKIINGGKTVIVDGVDAATAVDVTGSIELNDFYTTDRVTGEETLVSARRVGGNFVNILNKFEEYKNEFSVDMLINGTRDVVADEDKHIDADYLVVKGAVFNFRNALLPVEFNVKSEAGINYFSSLDASNENVVYTKVWGKINNQTIVTKKVEEVAFGEPAVTESTRNISDWVLTRAANHPYDFGDEKVMTTDDVKKAMADRNTYLADVKKRQKEYQASKANSTSAAATGTTAAAGAFNF